MSPDAQPTDGWVLADAFDRAAPDLRRDGRALARATTTSCATAAGALVDRLPRPEPGDRLARRARPRLRLRRLDAARSLDAWAARGGRGDAITVSRASTPPRAWSPRPARSRGRATVELVVADAVAHLESLADGSVDGVLAAYLLRNVPDRDRLVREVARVLRPGGGVVDPRLLGGRQPPRPGDLGGGLPRHHHPAGRSSSAPTCRCTATSTRACATSTRSTSSATASSRPVSSTSSTARTPGGSTTSCTPSSGRHRRDPRTPHATLASGSGPPGGLPPAPGAGRSAGRAGCRARRCAARRRRGGRHRRAHRRPGPRGARRPGHPARARPAARRTGALVAGRASDGEPGADEPGLPRLLPAVLQPARGAAPHRPHPRAAAPARRLPARPRRRWRRLVRGDPAHPAARTSPRSSPAARASTWPGSPRVDVEAALGLLDVDFPATYAALDGVSAAEVLDRLRFPEPARHLALEVFARSFFADPREFSGAELVAMFHLYFVGSAEGLLFDVPRDDYDSTLWAPLGGAPAPARGHGRDRARGALGRRPRRAGRGHRGAARRRPGTRSRSWLPADAVVLALDPVGPAQGRRRPPPASVATTRPARPGGRPWPASGRRRPSRSGGCGCPGRCRRSGAPFLGTSGYGPLDNVSVLELFEDHATRWQRRRTAARSSSCTPTRCPRAPTRSTCARGCSPSSHRRLPRDDRASTSCTRSGSSSATACSWGSSRGGRDRACAPRTPGSCSPATPCGATCRSPSWSARRRRAGWPPTGCSRAGGCAGHGVWSVPMGSRLGPVPRLARRGIRSYRSAVARRRSS